MAPLPEIADTYRVAFVWDGPDAVNVMHFHKSGATPGACASAIAGAVSAGMWKVMLGFYHVRHLVITPLFDNAATYNYDTDGSSKWGGSAAGSEMIPANAAVVSMKTVERGRSARGRVFIGPVAESEIANGKLIDATRTSMATAWNAFGGAIIGEGWEHVVASYKNATALTVTNYSIRAQCGTVRHRHDHVTGVT